MNPINSKLNLAALLIVIVFCSCHRHVNSIEYFFGEIILTHIATEGNNTALVDEPAIEVSRLCARRYESIEEDLKEARLYSLPSDDVIVICEGGVCPCVGARTMSRNRFYFVTPYNDLSDTAMAESGYAFEKISLIDESGQEIPLSKKLVKINGKDYDMYSFDMTPYERTGLRATLRVYFLIAGNQGEKYHDFQFERKNMHDGLLISLSK